MPKINQLNGYQHSRSKFAELNKEKAKKAEKDSGGFSSVMSGVATGALSAATAVSSFTPVGGLVKGVASGLQSLLGDGGGSGAGDQLEQMWAMQRESQMFNLQYLELQTEMQADNRRFSTMSNLMKVRHDTAKSAINNMSV